MPSFRVFNALPSRPCEYFDSVFRITLKYVSLPCVSGRV